MKSDVNEIYENRASIYSNNIKMSNFIGEHSKNSIYNFVFIVRKWCLKNLVLSFYIMLFIGALFCCPYFFKIGLIPDISIDSAIPTLFFISTIGLLIGTLIYVGFVFQNQLSFNILINIDNKKINNIIKFLASISWVIFFAIIMTPFAPDFYFIQSISEYILNNFNIILIVYVVILLIFCLVFFISKSTNKFPNIILYFIITVYFDFFILYAVYLNYNNINLSVLVISMFILFLLKIINLSKEPLNKLIISLSSIFIFFTICLISPNFVRGVKLANYKDDFTIKKEFVPKPILNLPNCFYSYNEACTYNLTNEEDKITIKNLLVRVKSDGRYHFCANMNLKDDFNLTKSILKTDKDEDEKSIDIKKRTSKILKIDENTTKNTYFIYNSDSNVTEVKNYHKLFLNFTKDKNIGIYYDFHVHEKNIVN